MQQFDDKIIQLIDAVYKISNTEKEQITWYLAKAPSKDKEKILIAVYKRFQAFEKNAEKLIQELEKVSNHIEEYKEHQSADEVLLELNN